MSLLVVGTDGPVARALEDVPPPATPSAIADAVAAGAPSELAVVTLPAPAGPVGALGPDAFADLLEQALTPAFTALALVARSGRPVRVAVVCPAGAVLPDHLDGARSVVGAGLAMLAEVASASPGLTANVVAVADDAPAEEVAQAVRFALAQPGLNGATIRLDGGRDAVLAAETRAEGD
jgi:hypothetical protein